MLWIAGRAYYVDLRPDGVLVGRPSGRSSGPGPADEIFVTMSQLRLVGTAHDWAANQITRPFRAIVNAVSRGDPFFGARVNCLRLRGTRFAIGLRSLKIAIEDPEFRVNYLDLPTVSQRSFGNLTQLIAIMCEHYGVA